MKLIIVTLDEVEHVHHVIEVDKKAVKEILAEGAVWKGRGIPAHQIKEVRWE